MLPVASTISIVDYTRAAQVCKSTITDFNKYVFDFEMLTFAPQEHTAVVDAEALVDFLLFLRLSEHYGMCTLTDIVSADAIDERKRFIVLYRLVNHESSAAIVAATATCEGEPIPTVASIFSSAVWAEREV